MCVCLVEQSEIGGAGGGLTGEQVDGGLTHTPDRTPGFTFPVLSHRKSSDEKTSCWSSRGHNLFSPRIPAHYGRVGECAGCCLQMGGRAQASHRLRWEGGGVSTMTEITLCLGLYAATAVGGGLVLRSIRVSAQFRFNVDIILILF